MRMRVLVTGAAGYVGVPTCARLLAAGFAVTGLDSLRYDNGPSLAGLVGEHRFRFVRADVRDRAAVAAEVRRVDAVVHLAALVGAPVCRRCVDEAYPVNQAAVEALVAELASSQRLVYPHTNSGYGRGGNEPVTEDRPQRPLTTYAASKLGGEVAALSRGNSVSLRLATVFGASPRMRWDLMVNDWVAQMVRLEADWRAGREDETFVVFEPQFRRNFVHVRDVAGAILHALHNDYEGPVNVGLCSANLRKAELAGLIARRLGLPERAVSFGTGSDPDQRDYVVSNRRALDLGMSFAHGLEAGIDEVATLARAYTAWQIQRGRNA